MKLWTPFLEKIDFTAQEAHRLTLGIRLANTPSEVHSGWKRNQLRANTIIEAWAGERKVLEELWTKDTLMMDLTTEIEGENVESQSLLTPTKNLYFEKGESILKPSRHTRKTDSESSQSYFKPRSNVKPKNKKDIFRKMAHKTYR